MDQREANTRWSQLLIDELVRTGVNFFVLSPGSRSALLTVAVARHPATRAQVHFDERGAAYFALGYARATGKPAALICTSGTAAANYFPAVIEASESGVPMILLTADRPPELRSSGANQTIDQVHLFGRYPRWFHDLPAPTPGLSENYLRSTVAQAVLRSLYPDPGPAHLNCPFPKPLEPETSSQLSPAESSVDRRQPLIASTRLGDLEIETLTADLGGNRRGLLAAGELRTEAEREAVLNLRQQLGWPLLPDITSGLRLAENAGIAHFYDLALKSRKFSASVRPDVVLRVGGRSVSQRLQDFLKEAAPEVVQIDPSPRRLDPGNRTSRRVVSDLVDTCRKLTATLEPAPVTSPYLEAWIEASRSVREVLEQESAEEMTEVSATLLFSKTLQPKSPLCLASSLAVRLLDMFALPGTGILSVSSNRGASGIDGVTATAAGFARGAGTRVRLLSGDLAMLHDLNSLPLLAGEEQSVELSILNNDGGGIFELLPISSQEDIFEPFFGTPHGFRFENAARQFGLEYHLCSNLSTLREAWSSDSGGQSRIIEAVIDRARSSETTREIARKIESRLDCSKWSRA